jgi:hypothetical protein
VTHTFLNSSTLAVVIAGLFFAVSPAHADSAAPGWSSFAVVGAGKNSVTVGERANVVGSVHANVDLSVKEAATTGNLEAGSAITVGAKAVVGTVRAPSVDVKKGATTGAIANLAASALTLPPVNAKPDATKDLRREGKAATTLTLAPGSYGDLITAKGDTLVLTSGSYHFSSMWVKHNNAIVVHLSGGQPLIVHVAGNLRFGVDNEMVIMSCDGGNASDILFLIDGESAWLRADGTVLGTYIAPKGTVIVGEDTALDGAALGSSVELRAKSTVRFIGYDHAVGISTCKLSSECDDGQACTTDSCDVDAGCQHVTNTIGCTDGNACTQGDSCNGGSCQGGLPINCDDGNPCTADSCDPAAGCVHSNNTAACTDGNACTVGDQCSGGSCVSSGLVNCADNNPCTDDACTPAVGCVHVNGFGACSDGNACTANDACSGGACVPGGPLDCNDDNPCTTDSCSPAGGCSHANNSAACTDGNACTTNDTCSDGACQPGPQALCADGNACTSDLCDAALGCVFANTVDGSGCSDGDACSLTDVCVIGACLATNPVICAGSDGCHIAGTCDSASGLCSNPSKPDGTTCNDNNACTQSDTCQGGSCAGSNPVICASSDQCHIAGSCDVTTGTCSNPSKSDGSACTDGNACTQSDTCQNGACTGSNPIVCSASDQCHVAGTCDATNGTCSNPSKNDGSSCNDGNACTQSDTCQSGTCNGSNPVTCSASDQCHDAGMCDSATGSCSNPSKNDGSSCNDGNACTQSDTCQSGTCNGSNPVTCSASDQCHDAGICDSATGSCSNPSKNDGSSCNDGNACTQSDTCQSGTCNGSNPVTCGASDQCHDAGTCDSATGTCSNPSKANGAACSDGNACTQSDTCQNGSCTGANPVVCAAPNPAELVVNGSFEAGSFSPIIAGNWVDICSGCAAGNSAITGWTVSGKVNWANNVQIHPTADGSKFIDLDDGSGKCSGSALRGVISQTIPTVVGKSYRLKFSLAAPYDSNDACSGTLVRKIRATVGGVPADFTTGASFYGALVWEAKQFDFVATSTSTVLAFSSPDGNLNGFWGPNLDLVSVSELAECHTNSCDTATGACVLTTNANGSTCSDGNGCTQSDVCQNGSCVGGNPVVCAAGDQCHDAGVCNAATGVCGNAPKTGSTCNDGNLCTQVDTCQNGTCVGNPVNCAATNSCHTTGTCDTATGVCSNPVLNDGSVCEDGNLCTLNDNCKSGQCISGAPVTCPAGAPCLIQSCDPGSGQCVSTSSPNGASCDDSNACTSNDVCHSGCVATSAKLTYLATSCGGYSDVYLYVNSGYVYVDVPYDCDLGAAQREMIINDPYFLGSLTGCNDQFSFQSNYGDFFVGYIKLDVTYGSAETKSVCIYDSNGQNCAPRTFDSGYEIDPYFPTVVGDCTASCNIPACQGDTTICQASDVCHVAGTCDSTSGNCSTGASVNCDDGFACTIDSCDSTVGGCVHVATTGTCDDGIGCTTDSCSVGIGCKHNANVSLCNDGNPCTTDSCNSTGCHFTNNSASCNDGNACTQSDTCVSGTCTGSNPVMCSSGDQCHEAGTCNASTGVCSNPNKTDGTACSDGNVCSTADSCQLGTCVGAGTLTCDDGNACTSDSCNPSSGCVFVANSTSCDDGNLCTTADQCSAGSCSGSIATSGSSCGGTSTCSAGGVCQAQTVPDAPSILSVAAASQSVSVEFAPPASDHGSAITSYTVTSSPGGFSATGASSPIVVSGLTNGVSYTFTMTATNAMGTGAASTPSSPSVPVGVPGAPTGVLVTVSGTSAFVSFAAPSDNGGSPITSYRATSSPGGLTATGASSPITVPGLVAGVTYTFSVVAINATGTGPSSAASTPVAIPTAPGVPTIVSVAAGNAQVTVQFTPPASNGGSPITSYTVISTPGNLTASGAASPLTVPGLSNGTSYTFRVKATSAFGTSALSAPSAAVVPKGPPGAPTGLTVSQSGNLGDRASVAFTAPVSNGGSPITSYKVTSTPGGFFATGAASPIIVTGLTPGVSFRFTATATNIVGTSVNSALSAAFVPTGKPDAPTITAVVPEAAAAWVSFVAPANNGGVPITAYSVTASPGGATVMGPSSPLQVGGLIPGTSYTFTVTATNSRGTSVQSAAFGPVAIPLAGAGVVLLTFNASLNAYIDVTSGFIFNEGDGSETDPVNGSLKVSPVSPVPTFVVVPPDALIVSRDAASQQYFTYHWSTFQLETMLEYDINGQPVASVQGLVYLVTSTGQLVNMLDGNFSQNGATLTGVLRDTAGTPITGEVVTFNAQQTPVPWLF